MHIKYDANPLLILNDELQRRIYDFVIKDEFEDTEKIDDVIKRMLEYNSVAFTDNTKAKIYFLYDNIYLYFVSGAKGNDYNQVYDYVDVYGSSYIIIFLDYFKGMKTKRIPEPDNTSIENKLSYMMGNSIYFDAICNIVTFYIAIISKVKPNPGSIQDKINSTAPTMIAANIINSIRELSENDCEDSIIPYTRIIELMQIPISNILLGLF